MENKVTYYCSFCGKKDTKLRTSSRKFCSIECRKAHRLATHKYTYDISIFENTSDLREYFVGLFAADGCLDRPGTKITFALADKQLIYDLKCKTAHTGSVVTYLTKTGTTMYSLSYFGHAVEYIKSLGYLPGPKTQTIVVPTYNSVAFGSFLRGFFDGDGCVGKNTALPGSVYLALYNSNKKFLEKLYTQIRSAYNIIGGSIHRLPNGVHLLKYSHYAAIQVFKRMYANSTICLNRKRKIYDEGSRYVRPCPDSFERVYTRSQKIGMIRQYDAFIKCNGATQRTASKALNLDRSLIYRWRKRLRKEGIL